MSGRPPQWLNVCFFFIPVWAPSVFAQSAGTGLPPEWEVRKEITALVQQARTLQPILREVKPEEWAKNGAPETYKTQLKSISSELEYVVRTADELSQEPERLTLALETYFRMQAMKSMLDSLEEGIRKYQNPALADLLQSAMSGNAIHSEKLRQYIVQLATVKEQEYKVMSEEAQRCRQMLTRQPPPKRSPGTRKESK